jgi:hypothetical protein
MNTLVEHKTDLDILFDYFTQIKEDIVHIATQKGMNASGKTLASLDIVNRPTGKDLYANESIYFMEHGRGPTKSGAAEGNPNLVEIIREWAEAKGLALNPYAVAKTIHKEGTRLFRDGGNSGVLSIPLNLETLEDVFNQMTLYWMARATSEIYEPINNFKTQ